MKLYKFYLPDGDCKFGEGETLDEASLNAGFDSAIFVYQSYGFSDGHTIPGYEEISKDDTMRCSCGTLNARGEWNSVVYCRKCGCLM